MSDTKEIKADMKALIRSMAVVEGKLSNMPSTFQMMTWFVGIALGLTGLVFTISKVMAAH